MPRAPRDGPCADTVREGTGVSLGGFRMLIASMASLISCKLIVRAESQVKGAYFRLFYGSEYLFLRWCLHKIKQL